MGLQARMMSQGLRKLASILAKTGTTCIFINQIRMKIGIMFGNPETTTGGNALKFYCSQRIEIRRGSKIEEDKEQIGYIAKLKVVKNKVAPPFKKIEIPVMFNQGYDHYTDLIETGLVFDLITRAGAFYTVYGEKVQGKDNLIAYLRENKDIHDKLEEEIQEQMKSIRTGKRDLPDDVASKTTEDKAGEESDDKEKKSKKKKK